jgi:hypothetical protein
MKPTFPFKSGRVDLLNYMIRRVFVERCGGWIRVGAADLDLIDRTSRMSRGNIVNEVLGVHRITKSNTIFSANSVKPQILIIKIRLRCKAVFTILNRTIYRIIFLMHLIKNNNSHYLRLSDHFNIYDIGWILIGYKK